MSAGAGFNWLLFVLIVLSLRLQGADTRARDLNGQVFDPFAESTAGTIVLIFVATDCPISNRYAPVVNDLAVTFSSPNLRFFAVYPDATATASAIRKHREEYGYKLPALLDPDHSLVRRAGATVTPEVAVFLLSPEAGASPLLIY
ncbi:MAG: hypothetical protein QG602_2974, partial [Verrucomicrobiota bacterium]|nr:hypothetical protein [Verrucomicrobiota bacterium]